MAKKETSKLKALSADSVFAVLDYQDKKIDKKELNKILDEASKKKRDSCKRSDGSFDFLKMSQMYHRGE